MLRKLIAIALLAANTSQVMSAEFDEQRDSEKPNIVLVVAEDLSARIGAYGDDVARTPNLDSLANEGVMFNNVYTMAGVCAPSRAGLITGAPPHRVGLQHMRTADREYFGVPPAQVKAYPEILRKNGYFTYNDIKTDYQFAKGAVGVGPFTIWSANGNVRNPEDSLVPSAWRTHDLQGKPFFLNLNPFITHESALFIPENTPPHLQQMNQISEGIRANYQFSTPDLDKITVPPYLVDTKETRQEIARFYENIEVMDQQVGAVIENLKKDKLWDNTIFIFTTDHGDALPRSKREGLVSGIKVPMIMHIPEKYKPDWMPGSGQTIDRLVSFEDIAPTLLGFAGIERLPYMQGIDLSDDAPVKRHYIFADRARMDAVDLRSYYVLDEKYQYVRNYATQPNGAEIKFRNVLSSVKALNNAKASNTLTAQQKKWFDSKVPEELYDLSKDAEQLVNLANNPDYAHVLSRFREQLDSWRNLGSDYNLIEENVLIQDSGNRHDAQQTTLPAVAEIDEITGKVFMAPRTEGASIGYSYDNKVWQVYDKSFVPDSAHNKLFIKAVRYGWAESEVITLMY